jgi:hypothetical protein
VRQAGWDVAVEWRRFVSSLWLAHIIVILLLQPSLKKLFQPACIPRTSIGLMLPAKNVVLVNLSIGVNGKRKLVTASIIAKEKQVIERHIKIAKTGKQSKLQITLLNVRSRPNDARAVISDNAICLQKKLAQQIRQTNTKCLLNRSKLTLTGGPTKLRVTGVAFGELFP